MSEANVWQFDREACSAPASVDLGGVDLQLFRDFVADAEPALQWISAIAGAPSIDSEELDRAYRKAHFVLGFCELLTITPAVSALEQLAREARGFGNRASGASNVSIPSICFQFMPRMKFAALLTSKFSNSNL